jgi:nucleoside 2-deoxyribosyltransferase
MSKRPELYLGSPCGFSPLERDHVYYGKIVPVLADEFDLFDPWSTIDPERWEVVVAMEPGPERFKAFDEINREVGTANIIALKRVKGIVVVLNGAQVDDGTAGELGFASALQKPILGFRDDFRKVGDNEAAMINIQLEAFIRYSNGLMVSTLPDLKEAARKLFLPESAG